MMKDSAQRGPGVVCCGGAGQHENSGTDDAADAEQCQLRGGECAPQLIAGGLLLVQLVNGLRCEKL